MILSINSVITSIFYKIFIERVKMKIFKETTLIKEMALILVVVLIFLFLHDFFNFSHPKSEDLFFPKLYENYCFHLTFERYIRDEKIISFECFEDMWHATGMSSEMLIFCYKGCDSSGDIIKYRNQIIQKPITEIEKQSQQYGGFSYFKRILKQEYYSKRQEPLTKAIISYFKYTANRRQPLWEADMMWYDHHSKILWYRKSRGRY